MAADPDSARALCEAALGAPAARLMAELEAVVARLPGGGYIFTGQAPPPGTMSRPIAHEGEHFGYLCIAATADMTIDEAIRQGEGLARLIGWLLHRRNVLDSHLQAERHAVERSAEQAQIIDQIQESVIVMDLAGYITGWNRGAERLFGYTAGEAIGRHILFLYADPDAADNGDNLQDALLESGGRELEVRRRRKNGEIFWASLKLTLLHDATGAPSALIGYLSDITARIETEKALRLQAGIFEHSEESILIMDATKHIVSVNPAFQEITGYRPAEVLGRTPEFLRSSRHPVPFYSDLWRSVERDGSWHGEIWTCRKSGEEFPSWASISLVRNRDGQIGSYFSIFSDITERKRAEERIRHLAYYDPLTDLPNRTLFFRLVNQALDEAERRKSSGAILFVDLNRFKPINDSLGHGVGDRVLRLVGDRLRGAVRQEDMVARFGGDEFVIALFDIARREHAAVVARKIIAALERPIHVDQHEFKVGAAIGISSYPQDGTDTESLLRMADIAMYRAKKEGGEGYAYFSDDMNRRAVERLKIESGLRQAIAEDALELHYQPKVDGGSGRIVGAEALVRWPHPERGLVSPAEFIPIAEESGLIVQLSAWVLQAALRQARRWLDAGLPAIRIAVNLSARDFSPGLAGRVRALLADHGVPPDCLELEITEGVLTQSSSEVVTMMDALVAHGVELALDDFGTGYSSLAYLKRFPIRTLKIDQSFVRGIPDDGNDCAIAGAIVSMAQQLGHRVIAEGVETRAQVDFLAGLGCREFQGFYFSRPLPVGEFEALLRRGGVPLTGQAPQGRM